MHPTGGMHQADPANGAALQMCQGRRSPAGAVLLEEYEGITRVLGSIALDIAERERVVSRRTNCEIIARSVRRQRGDRVIVRDDQYAVTGSNATQVMAERGFKLGNIDGCHGHSIVII